MDSTSNWRDKLTQFRIKELKDVLTQLGLAKQGKKQELMERILSLLFDEQGSKVHGQGKKNSIGKEGILRIIDDTYRKMQIPGATDLASKSLRNSVCNDKPKEEVEDSYQCNVKVRCLCDISTNTQLTIKCEDTRCQVQQHMNCVIVPEKQVDGVHSDIPSRFYCEICRINRADPFWETLAHPLRPIKLSSSSPAPDGSMTMQNTEKTFELSREDRELLQRTDYDLQVWCILLNDKVPFRMQWPQHIELQVNGIAVRTINRPATQLLGINGRDDGPVITTSSREGLNKICLSRADARIFCFGIRIARRRTLQQVLGLVPKESEGEKFEDALARVYRCIGGTNEKNADSDSDIEVVAENVTVNLRCPMSGSRIKIAGRFKPCVHMGCFDLATFVELNQRSRKWQCPICLKNYSLENVIIDPYFNRITSLMRNCGEDVNEIEVKPDGSWRAKNEGDHIDLGRWHLPDGSIGTGYVEKKPQLDNLKKVKQEGSSDGQTSLKFKRNLNGVWEVRKTDDAKTHSGSRLTEKYDNHINIPMSSSMAGSYRDGENRCDNLEGGGHVDFSLNNGYEFNSSRNLDSIYNVNDRTNTAPDDINIIILSDSEEDLTFFPSDVVYDTHLTNNTRDQFSICHPAIPELYPKEHGIGLSDPNIPWSLPTCSQTVSGFQLFSTDVVPDAIGTVQSDPLGFATVNGYDLIPDGGRENSFFMDDIPVCPTTEVNGSLVDNPLAFGNEDPALQIFLPSKPAIVSTQSDMNEHSDMSNVISTNDWISLRLGGVGATQSESALEDGLDSRHQFHSNEGRAEPVTDAASLLLTANNDESNKATLSCKRSDNPFSHPRQPKISKVRASIHRYRF